MVFGGLVLSAAAQASPEADAKDLFSRGRELRQSGNCAGAAELFRKAFELYPSGLGSLRNLAECEESLGHWATARREWIDLKRALFTNQDAKYAGWDADAEAASARLAPKVAKLTVDVVATNAGTESTLAAAARVVVLVNDEPLARALLGSELSRDPGRYRVRAQGADVETGAEEIVDLKEGGEGHVHLRVALRAAEPPPAPSPEPASRPAAAEAGGAVGAAGWAIAGVGVGALVASGVTFAVRQEALSDLRRACPEYASSPCPSSIRPTVDRGHLASTLTSVFLVSGGFLVAGGVTLVFAAPRARSTPSSAGSNPLRSVTLGVGPRALTASWGF